MAPASGAGPATTGEVRELDLALDALVQRFSQGAYAGEIARARGEYAERTGRVFEEDEIFEARTLSFLEWYALERRLEGAGVAPVEVALAEPLEGNLRAAWTAWATSHRSLYLVARLSDGDVRLHDVIGGARFAVDERRRLHGVSVGDIVEARLVGWRGKVRFGRTFCFHPGEARKAILAHVRRVLASGGTRADAIDAVAALRVRSLRYKHVEPERVYQGLGK
jgi:hypothetical protein